MPFAPKTRVVSPDVVEILRDVLRKTRHIQTTSILMVLDQIRTGEWATVLPKTIRITLANYDEIEAIPLPKTERTPSIGIVIPPREQSTPLAECFYIMATGSDTLRVLKTMMSRPEPKRRPAGRRRPPNLSGRSPGSSYTPDGTVPPQLEMERAFNR